MIIYQRSAGARFSFGVQVIFQTRMTRITRILKAALCLLHLIRMEKKRSVSYASSASEKLLACRRENLLQRYAAKLSFIEYKIHCQYQANECRKMIPMQAFTFKKDSSKYSENNKSNHLLNYLQLYQ